MNIIATQKHPYVSEGASIKASEYDAKMLIDRGYAVNTDDTEKEPKQKPKTKIK